MANDNTLAPSEGAITEILERLVRIETRQAKTMHHLGLDTNGTRRVSPLAQSITRAVTDSVTDLIKGDR